MTIKGMILPVPIKSRPPLKALTRKQMVYEVVRAEVKSYILEHGLKAGDPLPPETDLAQQLNVSRNSRQSHLNPWQYFQWVERIKGACMNSFVEQLTHGGFCHVAAPG